LSAVEVVSDANFSELTSYQIQKIRIQYRNQRFIAKNTVKYMMAIKKKLNKNKFLGSLRVYLRF
jgi:hypothetical protein